MWLKATPVRRALIGGKIFRVAAVVDLTFIDWYPRALWLHCIKSTYRQNRGVVASRYSRKAGFLTVFEAPFINWNDLAALRSKTYRNTV